MFSGPADSYPHLIGDIGGTNARFAMIAAPGAPISHVATLRCADYSGPLEAIHAWRTQQAAPTPRNGAIGIANPVTGDQLRLTNNPWAFSVEALRQALHMEQLVFVNDFTALALSLPHLGDAERYQVGTGVCIPGCAIGVIGPGTGLGVSGLIPSGKGYVPLGGEGGHVSLSPQTDEEFALTALLAREYGHVSAERVLSGPGLITLYRALAQVRGQTAQALDSAAITTAALSGTDALCAASLAMFCALLGSCAGNLALTLGARGGVFIGGGIVPRLGGYFAESAFRQRFEAKGRFSSYLAQIPTYVITANNPALIGAAVALEQAVTRG